jgi:hypothetical protein
MKRALSTAEKLEASQLAALWERSKFKSARVRIFIRDETDQDGRPIYEFVITGFGRLPKLTAKPSTDAGSEQGAQMATGEAQAWRSPTAPPQRVQK